MIAILTIAAFVGVVLSSIVALGWFLSRSFEPQRSPMRPRTAAMLNATKRWPR